MEKFDSTFPQQSSTETQFHLFIIIYDFFNLFSTIRKKIHSSLSIIINKARNNSHLFCTLSKRKISWPRIRDRDKYLDGAPISDYDKNWRKSQGFNSPRYFYWYNYWLPTLISSGRLAPSKEFLERVRDARSIPGTSSLGIAKLRDAVMDTYGSEDLKTQFSNATFTFREFLEFILWVDELGMRDLHWGTYTEQCLPCQEDYQYILHLETVDAESRVLLQDVGYPEDIRLATKHRTKGLSHSLSTNDLEYYKDLPKALVNKIIKFYEYDFELFGYNKDILTV